MAVLEATQAYATALEYREHQSVDKIDGDHDDQIENDLLAVSRWLDRDICHRRFFGQEGTDISPVTAEIVVKPWVRDVLDIGDWVSVASVKLDADGDGVAELTLSASDYALLPRNAHMGSEPEPYTQIGLRPIAPVSSWGGVGTWGCPIVHLVGVRGWPAVPAAIRSATIQLTAILRIESPRATTQVTELGTTLGTSKQAKDIVMSLARAYTRSWWLR